MDHNRRDTTTYTHTHPNTKKLIIIRGRGTPREQRIETDAILYRHRATGRWMTIPEDGVPAHSIVHRREKV